MNRRPGFDIKGKKPDRQIQTGQLGRSLLVITLLLVSSGASNATAQEKVTPEEAKAIAKETYIFNYPLVMMYRPMYL